jgi:hypothetical protein
MWDAAFRQQLLDGLVELGYAVESAFNDTPQDIEGVWLGGRFAVVQSRPQVRVKYIVVGPALASSSLRCQSSHSNHAIDPAPHRSDLASSRLLCTVPTQEAYPASVCNHL